MSYHFYKNIFHLFVAYYLLRPIWTHIFADQLSLPLKILLKKKSKKVKISIYYDRFAEYKVHLAKFILLLIKKLI